MEPAALNPVRADPPREVAPDEAIAHVARRLPQLDEPAAQALALVELARRPRADVAAELAVGPEAIAAALTRGRKALRRSMFPLASTGWCERAERLMSDRLDGELPPPGPARLDAHLRNCERCAMHERRLEQARDALVHSYLEAHPEPPATGRAAAGSPEGEAGPDLRVVEVDEAPEPPAEQPPPADPEVPTQPTPVAPPAEDPAETEEPPHPPPGGPPALEAADGHPSAHHSTAARIAAIASAAYWTHLLLLTLALALGSATIVALTTTGGWQPLFKAVSRRPTGPVLAAKQR